MFWQHCHCVSTLLRAMALYICTRKVLGISFKSKEITMKQLIALITTAFAVAAFAQAPAAKKEEKKVEAKPAATAPAPAASVPAKVDAKSAPAADKKTETPKK